MEYKERITALTSTIKWMINTGTMLSDLRYRYKYPIERMKFPIMRMRVHGNWASDSNKNLVQKRI